MMYSTPARWAEVEIGDCVIIHNLSTQVLEVNYSQDGTIRALTSQGWIVREPNNACRIVK